MSSPVRISRSLRCIRSGSELGEIDAQGLGIGTKSFFWIVFRARVVMRSFTQRFPSAHQSRRCCRLACCSFLVRMWEWLTAMPLLARVPVS